MVHLVGSSGAPQKGAQGNHRNIAWHPLKKGINRVNKEIFLIFDIRFRVLKHRFLAFSRGPGGFRELREAGRNHFHLSWYLSDTVVTSYKFFRFYITDFGFNNSGLTLELRVLVGIGRSGTLRGRVLS